MKKSILIFSFLFLSFPIYANDKDKKDTEPQLTQVEQLQIENLRLKAIPLQQQLNELQKEYNDLKSQIENENPGYTLNPQNDKLQKRPEAPKPSK